MAVIRCPHCRKPHPHFLRGCPHCDAQLPPPGGPPPPPPPAHKAGPRAPPPPAAPVRRGVVPPLGARPPARVAPPAPPPPAGPSPFEPTASDVTIPPRPRRKMTDWLNKLQELPPTAAPAAPEPPV